MFTGIIKALGTITHMETEGSNVHITIRSALSDQLSVDQSVAHDGICLTITAVEDDKHTVTAVQETLDRTALQDWEPGREVNLELAMRANALLDGHLVQGHVDTTARVTDIADEDGSWRFSFQFEPAPDRVLVDKGSVCINGTSLTVIKPDRNSFSVAIIPYTFEHTTFKNLRVGDRVNLEFDIIGKYVLQYARLYGAAPAAAE